MANVPEIRFKGFVDDWEQCKLGEIAEIKDSARIPNNEWQSHGVPYLRSSDISSKKINGELFISLEKYDFYKNRTGAPKKGDLLFNSGGDIGLAIYKNDETDVYVQGGSVLYVKTSESKNINGLFLQYHFSTSSTKTYITNNSTGSTIKHFVLKPAGQIPIDFPCINEQTCIGTFFRTLDNIIAIYKRKLDELRELKKAYLQQMFPQAGEVVPRVRFKGFTAPWVERKIGDVFTVTRGQVLAATKVSTVKNISNIYPVYSSQTKNNGLLGYFDEYLFDTAITWTTDGANAGTVNYRDGKFFSTNVSGVLISNDGYVNPCVAEAINMIAWKYVSKVGNPKLMNNTMSEITILLPIVDEQIIIGKFLLDLDSQIAMQVQKIELFNNLKTTYLQKMFI